MRARSFLLLAGLGALVTAAGAGSLFAQSVYVANSSNGRISVFDPAGAATPFPGDTKLLVTPMGIALDGAGALIVADSQRNRILKYEASGAGPSFLASRIEAPDGPSFGQGGDLFFVSSPGGASKVRAVYVIPGGAGPFSMVAAIPQSSALRETAVVPTGPYSGHLLVLSESPGFIARLAPDGAGGWTREPDFVAALPGAGTGMDFTTGGELLVSGLGGVIWRFDSSGSRLPDFASGLGVGPTRLAIGADGNVYVTNRNGPTVIRFDANGTRLADFDGGLQSPAGVAIQSLNPTPVGTNVTVRLLPGLSVTFDQVVTAGFTNAQQGTITPEDRITPCGNVLPSFILPPATGSFLVTLIETTAGTTDSIEVIQDHEDGNSRLFHASCPPDDEGFTDVTTLAIPGDPRGRVIGFSEFVVGGEGRDNADVVRIKMLRLESLVGPDSGAGMWIAPATLQTLRDSIALIKSLVIGDNEQAAIDELQDLKAFVRQQSGVTIPNSEGAPGGNIAGALEAHAATLTFSLSLFLPPPVE